ncbi:MAG: helix-turn-helix domain-containing protein [Bacillota bacterium]|nr:helix-turn-helix domain-containing protein [Bacillota bacterium]
MDQIKIGCFIKELRKEKELTQEQLAEKFNVSRRSVSRWETGSNMPDISIMIELADFFEVDIRELLDGQRKEAMMKNEIEETAVKVAAYSNKTNERQTKVVRVLFVVGFVALMINQAMFLLEIKDTFLAGFLKGATFGLACASMIFGFLYTTGRMAKIMEAKRRLIEQ